MDLIAWGFTIVVTSAFPYQRYGLSKEQDEAQISDPAVFQNNPITPSGARLYLLQADLLLIAEVQQLVGVLDEHSACKPEQKGAHQSGCTPPMGFETTAT
jgi:hypothetical protein